MSDAAGESLMTCMYCFDIHPQKDLIYHINYECRFAKEENKLPEIGTSSGYFKPQSEFQPYSVLSKESNNCQTCLHYHSLHHLGSFTSLVPSCRKEKFPFSATPSYFPESVIDKENPKCQELSSLDAKDVTLLTESMKEMLIKGSDHDVKIIVKDKEFQAHRNILSARSRVFAMMFNHDTKESSSGTINIEDCDPDSFDEFLLYVYCGRTEDLTPNKALHLYYTADKYDLPALKKRCAILLKTSLSVESICDVILLATRHDEKELLEEATKYFAQNMREILVTVHWQEFLSKNPIEGNELYIKSMNFLIPKK